MRKIVVGMGLLALALVTIGPAAGAPTDRDQDQQVRKRPRITIHPRHQPGPNSKRHCEAWLQKEYRVSGPVITPQMRCWWD